MTAREKHFPAILYVCETERCDDNFPTASHHWSAVFRLPTFLSATVTSATDKSVANLAPPPSFLLFGINYNRSVLHKEINRKIVYSTVF